MKNQFLTLLVALLMGTTISPFLVPVRAQSTFGVIEGTTRDASQAVLPGVKVTLRNQATNIEQATLSDEGGRYRFLELPAGTYTLTAVIQGFKTLVRTNIGVRAGEKSVVNVDLVVGSVELTITVSAPLAPIIETSTSHLSTSLSENAVIELPVVGRDFSALPLLAPGVGTEAEGGIGQFASNGQRSTTNTFTVDGTDINNPYWNVLQGGALGTGTAFASLDGIAELRIQTNNAAAEYGRTSGTTVTVVTKSGTNSFHGDVFEFWRNDILDANDWFANQVGQKIPPLRFNNFGGTLGGPVKRNKIFFFFLYEGQRENRFGFFQAIVPDSSVSANALPAMAPLLKYLPAPNGPEVLDASGNPTGTAYLNMATYDTKTENDYQAKVDFQLTSKDSLFYRQTVSRGTELSNGSTPYFTPYYSGTLYGYGLMSGTLVETHMFSPNVLNEFRFGWNRQATPFTSVNVGSHVMQLNSQGIPVDPSFSIGDTTLTSYGGLGPLGQFVNVFQPADKLSIIHGRHSLAAGFDIRRTQVNQSLWQSYNGGYFFPTVTSFEQDQPLYFYAIRGNVSQYPRTTNYSFYGQDDFKFRPNLTVNLGLRYELNTVISEAHGNISNLVPLNDLANAKAVLGARYNGDHDNFAPRVGFAWDIHGHQKNVLRAAFGVYYDVGPGFYGPHDLVTNPPVFFMPFLTGAQAAYPVDQSLLVPTSGLPEAITAIPPNNRTPYSMQYNLSYQRNLPKSFALTISYVGEQGRKMYRLRTADLTNPATGQLINPNFSQITISEDEAASSYNGMQMTVDHPFQGGSYLHASYTYSHSIDDSCGFAFYLGSPCVASNPFNLEAEKASSSTDIRQNYVMGYFYTLPIRRLLGGRGVARLLDGWQLSGIFSAHTGLPYTVLVGFDNSGYGADAFGSQRPNIVPGQPQTLGPPRGPDYRLNRAAFSIPPPLTFGDLRRNTFRGESFWNLDSGLFKETRVHESLSLQFRAEFFNLFNHPNFGVPGGTNTLLTPPSSFGVANAVTERPREIQLGLKLRF
jgi:outer membrane receptor protein involved in Fe transport